ncbi:hypothetical protein M3Y98_00709700 [Aphelenchoides besseyi]|nr:hypothetical protein M3Y98_00709700 [Aphelenchoides besseyi]
MSFCKHTSKTKVSGMWTIPEDTLRKLSGNLVSSNSIWFPFCPNIKFWLNAEIGVDNSADVFLSSNGHFDRDDFQCFLRAEKDGKVFGKFADGLIAINERVRVCYLDLSIGVHFKIVFKKECPLCLEREAVSVAKKSRSTILTCESALSAESSPNDRKRKSQNTKDQIEEIKRLKKELTENSCVIAKLTIERKDLTDKLFEVVKARDQLKSKAIEFERRVQKAQDDYQSLQIESNKQITDLTTERDNLSTAMFDHYKELYKKSLTCGYEDLKDFSFELLKSQLTTKRSPDLMILAVAMKDVRLIEIVIEFTDRHGGKEKLFLSDEFAQLFNENVELYGKVMETLRL